MAYNGIQATVTGCDGKKYTMLFSRLGDDVDINVVDAKGDGEFFLIQDGEHPLAVIVNSCLTEFTGLKQKGGYIDVTQTED